MEEIRYKEKWEIDRYEIDERCKRHVGVKKYREGEIHVVEIDNK